jgi:hypothetical protein
VLGRLRVPDLAEEKRRMGGEGVFRCMHAGNEIYARSSSLGLRGRNPGGTTQSLS